MMQERTVVYSSAFLDKWEIAGTAKFIINGSYMRIALQFPDELLSESSSVAAALRSRLRDRAGIQVFVLADSTYHSLGVDEVAAAHVKADCVVHYGYASLVPVSGVATYFVFPKRPLSIPQVALDLARFAASCSAATLLVFPDQVLHQQLEALQAATQEQQQQGSSKLVFARVAATNLAPRVTAGKPSPLHSHTSTPAPSPAHSVQPPAGTTTTPPHPSPCIQATQCCAATQAGPCNAGVGHSDSADLPAPASTAAQCNNPDAASTTTALAELQLSECSSCGCEDQALSRPCVAAASVRGGSCCSGSSRRVAPATAAVQPDTSGDVAADRILCWHVPHGTMKKKPHCVWLGNLDSPLLLPLQLTLNQMEWSHYDPATACWHEGVLPNVRGLLKKRHYLVEKARSANIVGLLVGTLGTASCLPALESLRELAHRANKKTYTVLMGKPAPQKLANFPEIEVFVMLADPQAFILDSKEYYAPIITPFEAYLAFSGKPWSGEYSLELDCLLNGPIELESEGTGEDDAGSLVVHEAGALLPESKAGKEIVTSAAQFLSKRTWQGLATPLTGAELKEPELAQIGFSGRAATYSHESISQL